jgi:hypothetical protein
MKKMSLEAVGIQKIHMYCLSKSDLRESLGIIISILIMIPPLIV